MYSSDSPRHSIHRSLSPPGPDVGGTNQGQSTNPALRIFQRVLGRTVPPTLPQEQESRRQPLRRQTEPYTSSDTPYEIPHIQQTYRRGVSYTRHPSAQQHQPTFMMQSQPPTYQESPYVARNPFAPTLAATIHQVAHGGVDEQPLGPGLDLQFGYPTVIEVPRNTRHYRYGDEDYPIPVDTRHYRHYYSRSRSRSPHRRQSRSRSGLWSRSSRSYRSRSRSRSHSPRRRRSWSRSRSRSHAPRRYRSRSRSPRRSRSRTPPVFHDVPYARHVRRPLSPDYRNIGRSTLPPVVVPPSQQPIFLQGSSSDEEYDFQYSVITVPQDTEIRRHSPVRRHCSRSRSRSRSHSRSRSRSLRHEYPAYRPVSRSPRHSRSRHRYTGFHPRVRVHPPIHAHSSTVIPSPQRPTTVISSPPQPVLVPSGSHPIVISVPSPNIPVIQPRSDSHASSRSFSSRRSRTRSRSRTSPPRRRHTRACLSPSRSRSPRPPPTYSVPPYNVPTAQAVPRLHRIHPVPHQHHSPPEPLDYFQGTFLEYLPRQIYLHFLLRLPALYFSRVTRIFEEAELSMPEIKRMALETVREGKDIRNGVTRFYKYGPEVPTQLYTNLKSSWETFIDSLMREWKTLNIISVLLLSAILTILQIQSAVDDPLTRYAALLSLICALMSLLYGCMYIIQFGTMRKTHKAAEWAAEAQKTKTIIWWNVWILLAMPAAWLSWSIILYIICIMSFVWRTGISDGGAPKILTHDALWPRILISAVLGLGVLYFILIMSTFRRYGNIMDQAWRDRVAGWAQEVMKRPASSRQMPIIIDKFPSESRSPRGRPRVSLAYQTNDLNKSMPGIHPHSEDNSSGGNGSVNLAGVSLSPLEQSSSTLHMPLPVKRVMGLPTDTNYSCDIPDIVSQCPDAENNWGAFVLDISQIPLSPLPPSDNEDNTKDRPIDQLLRLVESWNEKFFLIHGHQTILAEESPRSDPNQTNLAIYLIPAVSPSHPFQTVDERFGPVPDELVKIDLILLSRHKFETENRVSLIHSRPLLPNGVMQEPRTSRSSTRQSKQIPDALGNPSNLSIAGRIDITTYNPHASNISLNTFYSVSSEDQSPPPRSELSQMQSGYMRNGSGVGVRGK